MKSTPRVCIRTRRRDLRTASATDLALSSVSARANCTRAVPWVLRASPPTSTNCLATVTRWPSTPAVKRSSSTGNWTSLDAANFVPRLHQRRRGSWAEAPSKQEKSDRRDRRNGGSGRLIPGSTETNLDAMGAGAKRQEQGGRRWFRIRAGALVVHPFLPDRIIQQS